MDLAKEKDTKKKIVVLGGGFAGIYAAMELDRRLGRQTDVSITMVDRNNFFLFTPMLHEVAASDLDVTSIVSPIRQLLHHSTFLQGAVTAIDLDKKQVKISHCGGEEENIIEFDYLLLALGAQSNFYNLPGLQENAMTMQSLRDAMELRNAMIQSLEEAEIDAFTKSSEPLLTYVVAGGGFAGVETVAAMNDFIRESLQFYPHLHEDMVRVVLVHDQHTLLPEIGEDLGIYAQKKLSERKVEFKMDVKVTGYSKRGVELADGTAVKAVLFVWTAGISPNAIVRTLPCKIERGKVAANEYMEVPGYPFLWACGDCAYILDPATGKPYPPTAQHASRMGKMVARNMEATIRGGNKEAFVYKSVGALAAIGRRSGVANVMGYKFSGFLAWMMWRVIYLAKLPRLEKKIRVAVEWTMDLLFPKDMVQFMSLHAPLVQNERISHEPVVVPVESAPPDMKDEASKAPNGPAVEKKEAELVEADAAR
jgi:NADH dehydrogenase